MPRRVNVPELVPGDRSGHELMIWQFYDECYPSKISAKLDITSHPDPFTPQSKRVCHHAAVQAWGMGVVDLGWCVTGEPEPEPAVLAVLPDPKLMLCLRDGFGDTTSRRTPKGDGIQNKMWGAYFHIVRLTLLGLAVAVVRESTLHRATQHFLNAARVAEYAGNGMLVAWPGYSGVDLSTF